MMHCALLVSAACAAVLVLDSSYPLAQYTHIATLCLLCFHLSSALATLKPQAAGYAPHVPDQVSVWL